MAWNYVNKLHTVILRSTNQQSATDAGLLYVPPSFTQPGAPPGRDVQRMTGLIIRRAELLNITAATDLGLGFRIANRYWRAGNTDGTTFTEDTADAQDLGASDFTIGANTAAGNTTNFTVLSTIPFDWVSINIGTAEVDDVPTAIDHSLQYSNSAGTGWTAYTAGYLNNFELTNTVLATGAREFVWTAPSDWGKVVSLAGLPTGYYAWSITTAGATAGDTAALGTAMEIGTMRTVTAVAANTLYAFDFAQMLLAEADAVVAFFDQANANNRVTVEVTTG